MTESCDPSWSRQDEFFSLENCDIPVLVVQCFETVLIVTVVGLLFFMSMMLVNYGKGLCARHKAGSSNRRLLPNVILIGWTVVHLPLSSVRGILNLSGIYSQHSLWANVVNCTASASMTGAAIFFMYLELKIIIKGSLNRSNSLVPAKWILGTIGVVQALLFAGLPILGHSLVDREENPLFLYFCFWIPSTTVAFVGITYFFFLGMSIYIKLKRAVKTFPSLEKTTKKLLVFLLVCTALGITMGVSGLTAMFFPSMGWYLIKLCWFSACLFDFLIFYSLAKQKPRPETNSSSVISAPSIGRGTEDTIELV